MSNPSPITQLPMSSGPVSAADWRALGDIQSPGRLLPMPKAAEAVEAPEQLLAKFTEYERLYGEAEAAGAEVRAKEAALKSADDSDMRAQVQALRDSKADPGSPNRTKALAALEKAQRRRQVAVVACRQCHDELLLAIEEHSEAWTKNLDRRWAANDQRVAALADDLEAAGAERLVLHLVHQFVQRRSGSVDPAGRSLLSGLANQVRIEASRE